MNYPSAKANGFPTQSTANSIRNLSYIKAVGLDGSSYRSPVLIELESQNMIEITGLGYRSLLQSLIHILNYVQNCYYIGGHSSHGLKTRAFSVRTKDKYKNS